jgi:predicted ATPase/signal transduction histidine kinase
LQWCFDQLQETGTVQLFEIGTRDLCDRFLIPEKLYGREAEVAELLAAFDRVASQAKSKIQNPKSELMLVAGFSGIGKTAVVNEIHKPIVRQHGYFIKGKFDQFNRNIPFSAFVQAFCDLIGQLLSESDSRLQGWRTKLLQALGDNAQVIIDVIPDLERILGPQAPAPELSGTAAQNRFNLLFQKFIQVFITAEHPLVMFLDDLQWVDSASLNLIKLLMGESQTGSLLLIGAYRDNEVFPAHPLMLMLDEVSKFNGANQLEELGKGKTTVNTITLKPVSVDSLNQLVADTLNCAIATAHPLTKLIDQKTQGNPFFATQFLKALHQDQLITFDAEAGYWQCDISQVRAAALTNDVVEFMAQQLQKLPNETQQVLKLAACIGNQFDLEKLAIVAEQSEAETAAALWKVLQAGFILPQSEVYKFYLGQENQDEKSVNQTVYYKFLHDRVQQAAYSLIPEDQKPSTHLKIGKLLLNNRTNQNSTVSIFQLVNQLNLGRQLIRESAMILQLAELNKTAGRQAKQSTAYAAAVAYFQIAIELLSHDVWQQDYELALDLYTEAINANYLNGDFARMNQLLGELQKWARADLDLVKAQETQVEALVAQGKLQESLNLGLEILAQFGIHFPKIPTLDDYTFALERTKQAIGDRTPTDLIDLPLATDKVAIAMMRLLVKLAAPAFLVAPPLYPLLPYCGVELSVRAGVSTASTFLFACYGLLHCAILNDYKTGYEFGQLTLALSAKLEDQEFRARAFLMNGLFIIHWNGHLRDSLPFLQSGYNIGLETGDIAYTGYSAYSYCFYSYLLGNPLPDLLPDLERYQQVLQKLNQGAILNYHNIYYQIILNLLGQSDSICTLGGNFYNELEMLPLHQSASDYVALAHLSINKLMLNVWFGNWESALEYSDLAETYLGGAAGVATVPFYYFYDSLARISHGREISQLHLTEHTLRIEQNLEKLAIWAQFSPMNHQHKLDLVNAERCQLSNQKVDAIALYDLAINGAKENGYLQEEALANELAAKFYLDWGKEKVAAGYMQEAYYCYARWGAIAKTNDLEYRYPQLLAPILQQSSLDFNPSHTLTTPLATARHSTSTTHSCNISRVLDFNSAIKAAQAISSTIQLDELIATLTQIMMENSGAETCALILPNGENWQIRSLVSINPTVCSFSEAQSLEDSVSIPVKLIHYVKRTQEQVQISGGQTDLPNVIGAYILQHQPQSMLCTPILHQGNLVGILYLEHRSAKGMFAKDRLNILRLLTAQAAISLENALLYNTLEQKVEQRTQELSQTLEQLTQAQSQLIQAEKMSSLGQLVAGIAHEINNPVNFIHGNLTHIESYTQELLELVALYQTEYPQPSLAIVRKIEEMELDFICQDIAEVLGSMHGGTQRIRDIVRSLRNFSRLDEAEVKSVDIHEGLDSALMILQNRLKSTRQWPEIQVAKAYSNLPPVKCYAGQLNQALMNILVNAIDALRESKGNKTPQICISTDVIGITQEEWIRIAIADNGPGISETIQARIFDPFFTTKPVGKGTGMGLAITYQIIVEKHQGKLIYHSTPGQGSEFVIEIPIH